MTDLKEQLLKTLMALDRGEYIGKGAARGATNDVLKLFTQYAERVIGNDRAEEDDSGGTYKVNKYIVAENRLRREQRKRLKLISKGTDE